MSNLPADPPADFAAAFAKLSAISKLGVEDMKLMILLETAGEPLYAGLAEAVGREEAKALLLQNGREETRHGKRVEQVIALLGG
jgi:rubrerythrin